MTVPSIFVRCCAGHRTNLSTLTEQDVISFRPFSKLSHFQGIKYSKMDEFLLQQNRHLDDELSNIRSLISEVAAKLEESYDLQLSMAVLLSPDVMSGVREAVEVMKEAEAQLSLLCNNPLNEATGVKIERLEGGGDCTVGNDVTSNPDCTIYVNDE